MEQQKPKIEFEPSQDILSSLGYYAVNLANERTQASHDDEQWFIRSNN